MLLSIGNWTFDPISALITLFVAPVALYLLFSIRQFLRALTRYIVEGLLAGASRIATQRIAASLSLRRYCKLQLAGQSRYLNVPGTIEINLDIDQIFVPLVLERAGSNEFYSHADVLSAGHRIRIIGDPGSGKSSIAKRLLRDECTKGFNRSKLARFPLFIELRRIEFPKTLANKNLGDWLYQYLLSIAKRYDVYEIERCFSIYASNSGLLIILDGLDEVSAVTYPRMEAAINGLAAKLNELGPNNIVVLTMRTQFYQQIRNAYVNSFPIVLSLKQFSPTDIYEFLTRWPFSDPRRSDNVVRIYNDLTDRPALREMCTNPLILSMYVAQDQASGHQLAPDSRTDFYAQVTEELMIRRRAKQIGATEAQSVLREQRQRILGKIAFDHLCNGDEPANLISWEHGVRTVSGVTGSNFDIAESTLRDIAKDTGLITEEREGETFRFIHLTFCEFLAAGEAVHGRGDGWSILMDRHVSFRRDPQTRARLAEVIPFAAALMPRYLRPDAIATVEARADYHILALTFLETKLYDNPVWPRFIEAYRDELLSGADRDWDSEWLRELHLFLVVAADADRAAGLLQGVPKADAVTAFFQYFATSGSTRIFQLIMSYARHDATAAFRVSTLCGMDILTNLPQIVVENADQPPFLAIALERATRDSANPQKWAALFAEAGLRSPAAAALLQGKNDRPWLQLARALPRRHQWVLSKFIPDSLYSDCLSLTHALNPMQSQQYPLLKHFTSLSAPRGRPAISFYAQFVSSHFWSIVLILYLAFGIWSGSFIGTFDIFSDHLLPRVRPSQVAILYSIAGLIIIELIFVITYLEFEKRCRLYSAIANLNYSGISLSGRKSLLPVSIWTRAIARHTEPRADSRAKDTDEIGRMRFVSAGRAFLAFKSQLKTQSANPADHQVP
jgi:hypothetical protein